MNFVRNVGITFVTRLGLVVLSLVSSILTAHFLGPVGRGTLAVLGVITAITSQFGMLGLNAANNTFSARYPTSRPQIIGNTLWISVVNGCLCMLIASIFILSYPEIITLHLDTRLVWITIMTIPLVILATLLQNALIGQGLMVEYNTILLLSQLATTVMTAVVLFLFKGTLLHIVVGMSVVALGSAIANLAVSIRGSGVSISFDYTLARTMFGYSIKLFVAQFFSFLVLRSDLYFVNVIRGGHETGIYATAVQFADLILLIPATIGLVLFPRVSADPEHRLELGEKTIRVTLLFTLLTILVAIPLFTPVVRLLFGEAFVPSVHSMNLLWPGIFFMSGITMITYYIASHKLTWDIPIIWIAGAIVNTVLNLIFIPHFGAPVAALNSSISYGIIFLAVLYIYRRTTGAQLRKIFIVTKSDLHDIWRQLRQKRL